MPRYLIFGKVAAAVPVVLMTALSLVALVWSPFRPDESAAAFKRGTWVEILSENSATRIIRQPAGVVTIPANPKRICALGFQDELVALGVRPVAVPRDWRGQTADYLSHDLKDIQLVPQLAGSWLPGFDAIAAVHPDLILAAVTDQHDYRQLATIAPTVVLRDSQTLLKENSIIAAQKRRLRDLGAVLGMKEQAETYIATFDRHTAETKALIGDKMRGKTIAFFRTHDREWRLYGSKGDNGAQAVYTELGLQAPQIVSGKGTAALDPESMAGFDADYLIIVGDETPGSRLALNRLERNPFWSRVTAIREHHTLELSIYRHWIGGGLVGKSRMIDEFADCILGRVPENLND